MNAETVNLFSLGEDIPEASLKADYVKVEETAFGNPAFAYSMVVHSDYLQIGMEADDARMHADRPTMLASFIGPLNDNGNPMIQVYCQGLVKEIAADAWLKHFAHRDDTTIVEVKSASALQAEAVIVREAEEGARLAVRVTVQIHGNRLFMIQCTAPEDLFGSYVDSFGISVATFKPTHAMAQVSAEVRSNFRLDDALFFQMPYSWPFERLGAPKGMDGYSFLNLGTDGAPAGAIKVMSLRRVLTEGKADLDLPALLASEFTKTGLVITGVVSEENIPVPPPFTGGSSKVLMAKLGEDAEGVYNLVITAVDTPTHHVLIGVLTCAPSEDFYLNSVNMRAFEIVLETLKPGEPS